MTSDAAQMGASVRFTAVPPSLPTGVGRSGVKFFLPQVAAKMGAPAFRLTDGDVVIIRHVAQHRFLRSKQIAALVHRSVDRCNDRLLRLFHAGYIDRPRAQLELLSDIRIRANGLCACRSGAQLLAERCSAFGWDRKNREAGRPFIEHQLEIVEFYVSLKRATRDRTDVRLIHSDQLVAVSPERTRQMRNPLAMRVSISQEGTVHEIGLVPDLVFGLAFADGSRRCFMVEIDRGTMPVSRSDLRQTSFERKMRAYLTAHAAKEHERQFNWKTFRVLVVTTDRHRARSIVETLQQLHIPQSPGALLFFFATRDELSASDPLAHVWRDGSGRDARLV